MTTVAYTPKEAYKDPDALGAVFINDGTTVDVRALVAESPDGVFVVDDPAVIHRLDDYAPLKRVAVPSEVREREAAEKQAAKVAEEKAIEAARATAKAVQAQAEQPDGEQPTRTKKDGGSK